MNRNLIIVKTSIFKNKLSSILDRLQQDRDKIPQQTKEAIVAEAVKLLSLFYKTLDGPGFNPTRVVPGTSPEVEDYNNNLQSLSDDLDILFSELENLEAVVIEHFNTFTTQANRINARIKRLSSSIVNFELFSKLPIKNSIFLSDSFSDTSKIDVNSPLLNTDQCEIDQVEGIIKLPLDSISTRNIQVTIKPTINSNSNGVEGNNQEIGITQTHDDISVINDENPDTWFEYERVVQDDDGVPLVLDFTLNLGTEDVINFIRINPNNFGTKTQVKIEDISTSIDGLVYKSIKDEFTFTGITAPKEDELFTLAAATNKFAGQGLFSFTPRFAKYVRIILRQLNPYIIQTTVGPQFRYAIGIRDIEVDGLGYKQSGELVSSVFDVGAEIKKVALRTHEFPGNNELGSILHQISIDDGNSWLNIEPINDNGTLNIPAIAEVLNINTEDTDSVNTSTPVTTIRYKAKFHRNDDAFNSSSSAFAEEIEEASELKTVPLVEPWALTLDKVPVDGSIALLDTNFGSRGNPLYKLVVGTGTGGRKQFNLPWGNIRLDRSKTLVSGVWNLDFNNIATVYVEGEEWTSVPDINAASNTDKVFQFVLGRVFNIGSKQTIEDQQLPDAEKNTTMIGQVSILFGDGTHGVSPAAGALIEVLFSEERLYPVHKGPHTAKLQFLTGSDKSVISIYRKGQILPEITKLNANTNIHKLKHRNIIVDSDHPITFTNTDGTFTHRVTFSNGTHSPTGELISSGDWSIDVDRGIIYSFDRTFSSPGSVSYYYQDQVQLDATHWDWGDDLSIHRSVEIKEQAWVPNKIEGFAVISGVNKINLPNLAILEGSVQFNGISGFSSSDNPFVQEVPFIDGVDELSTTIKVEDKVPTLTPVSSVASFVTNIAIVSDTKFPVVFSNTTVFATSVGSLVAVNSLGKYFIDRSTGTISVHTGGATLTDTGTYSYYTSDPAKIPTGAYSIDYESGEIYTQRPVPSSGVTINYQYVDYFIQYNIGRKVSPNMFTFDPVNNRVLVSSGETALRARIQNLPGTNQLRPATYQVDYKFIATVRKNIEQLVKFYTPVLRDYILQIVTADQL